MWRKEPLKPRCIIKNKKWFAVNGENFPQLNQGLQKICPENIIKSDRVNLGNEKSIHK